MGYSTDFFGHIDIAPALSRREIEHLRAFCDQVHGRRRPPREGEAPRHDSPAGYCQFIPSDDGARLEWDGGEKFYDAAEWMSFVCSHFLRPNPVARVLDPQGFAFLVPHQMHGILSAIGEDTTNDLWQLRVEGHTVSRRQGVWGPKAREALGMDSDESERSRSYRGPIEMAAHLPEALWGDWQEVPAFSDPNFERLYTALSERQALSESVVDGALTDATQRL